MSTAHSADNRIIYKLINELKYINIIKYVSLRGYIYNQFVQIRFTVGLLTKTALDKEKEKG